MKIPVLKGVIRRRLLVNFCADPQVIQAQLPKPFRPKLHCDQAIVGVCLIRLENIRPASSPLPFGFSSENAAHRIAVLWNDVDGQTREGVFIPRRDTGSLLNHWTGGRVFPGQHHLASFSVKDGDDAINFKMRSRDGAVEVRLTGAVGGEFPSASCFASLPEASAFFESGSLGYSVRAASPQLDGLLLQTQNWRVETLEVSDAHSSYFADESKFPRNSIAYDHTLLMRDIEHQWHAAPELCGG